MTLQSATDSLTVTQLTMAIKNLLEPRFHQVKVQGEISDCKVHSSGHLYFNLKDKNSQISAALFKGNAQSLSRLPKSGDQVTVTGSLSIYAPRGNYQLIVREVLYSGVGDLLLKLHQTKEKLEKWGWFDPSRKKKLPQIPKRIGVVTSPTGAVIRDIIHVLSRRFSNIHLILNPVKVQGEGSAQEIAQAIKDFNTYQLADVLIVGRGGGSLEDLWSFNEEIVAEAIFHSTIPIISAVGHETDFSLADFVADVRAPTPSAAAEIVIAEKAQLSQALLSYRNQMQKGLSHRLARDKAQLKGIARQTVFTSPYALLGRYFQQLDDFRDRLDLTIFQKLAHFRSIIEEKKQQATVYQPKKQLEFFKSKIDDYRNRIDLTLQHHLRHYRSLLDGKKQQLTLTQPIKQLEFFKEKMVSFQKKLDSSLLLPLMQKKEKLLQTINHLKSLDPKNLLKKGYSILFSEKTGSLILSTDNIAKNDTIIAHLCDGKITANVTEVKVNYD